MSDVLQGMSSITHVTSMSGIPVQVADSVAFGSAAHRGHIVVCGSHGGRSAAEYALRFGYGALFTNDAGRGLNDAGVAGLRLLDEHGVPGVGMAHTTARIGDGHDGWRVGRVSFANRTALAAGVREGQATIEAAAAVAAWLREQRP